MLRALQPDILIFVAFCLAVGAAWIGCRRLAVWSMGPSNYLATRLWINRIAVVLLTLAALWLGWCVVLFSTTNRTPRADIDRSGVYEQMNKLTDR